MTCERASLCTIEPLFDSDCHGFSFVSFSYVITMGKKLFAPSEEVLNLVRGFRRCTVNPRPPNGVQGQIHWKLLSYAAP